MKNIKGLPLCPVCNSLMEVQELACTSCEVMVKGSFIPSPLKVLSDKDEEFVLLFLQARGNLKEMERVLGVSYPTVRSRMEAIIEKLGLTPFDEKEEEHLERVDVLKRLEKGEINTKEAMELLRKERR